MRFVGFLALIVALPACSSTPATPTGCDPPCPNGSHCDETGSCMPDPLPPDMAVPMDFAGACYPACTGAASHCNAQGRCVACITSDHCAPGFVCKADTGVCVQGCSDDSRCRAGDGGASAMACCAGQCTDTASDTDHCGGCGMPCRGVHSSSTCAAGQCQPGTCDAGWGDCNQDPKDGCETNLHVDARNCTKCGSACVVANAVPACADGCYIAACKFGFDDCNGDPTDGCETPVLSDVKNCGACGNACMGVPHARSQCINAACQLTSCDQGWSDCDNKAANGCETTTATDKNNCGRCGNACGGNLVCVNGGCTCQQCNIPNARSKCINNQCVFDSCLPGFADCNNNTADGCEVSLLSDAKNCGACGAACPNNMPYCSSGVCANINSKILVVGAPGDPTWLADVKKRLDATGAFMSVDTVAGNQQTPTVQQMSPYGAVLVFSDGGFADAAGLGNNLADYFDGGGSVVVAVFANASVPVQGRFGNVGNGYVLINPAGQEEPADSLGQILEQNSPLVVGVNKLTATACYRSTGGAVNGGVVVAQWASGRPLIVRGVVKGRNRVDLNFYPPSGDVRNDFWVGDGANIMRNALLYR